MMTPRHILEWYLEAGVDECIGDMPVNRYAASPIAPETQAPAITSPRPLAIAKKPNEAAQTAHDIAASCQSIEALRDAIAHFDHPLKSSARQMVFADGDPASKVMIIGEAPGFDEDREGLPFVGASGQILNKMLASIGLQRQACYITNVVFWRPPANRRPALEEVESLLPFTLRHIALLKPQAILLLGGTAASTVLQDKSPMHQLRGQWRTVTLPESSQTISALATYHPAYLLRTPESKAQAWRDLLIFSQKLKNPV